MVLERVADVRDLADAGQPDLKPASGRAGGDILNQGCDARIRLLDRAQRGMANGLHQRPREDGPMRVDVTRRLHFRGGTGP